MERKESCPRYLLTVWLFTYPRTPEHDESPPNTASYNSHSQWHILQTPSCRAGSACKPTTLLRPHFRNTLRSNLSKSLVYCWPVSFRQNYISPGPSGTALVHTAHSPSVSLSGHRCCVPSIKGRQQSNPIRRLRRRARRGRTGPSSILLSGGAI